MALKPKFEGKSELEIPLGIIPRIIGSNFYLNYSYQNARDANTHDPVAGIAEHKGNIGLGFHLSAADKSSRLFQTFSDEFSLYLNLFLCGERHRSKQDPRDPLAGYGLLDMTLKAYDLFQKGLDVSLTVNNLLDAEYAFPSDAVDEDGSPLLPGDLPGAGRSFLVEFRYSF